MHSRLQSSWELMINKKHSFLIIGPVLLAIAGSAYFNHHTKAQGQPGPDSGTLTIATVADSFVTLSQAESGQSFMVHYNTDTPPCQDVAIDNIVVGLSKWPGCALLPAPDVIATIRLARNGPDLAYVRLDGGKITSTDYLNPSWVKGTFVEPAVVPANTTVFLILKAARSDSIDTWTSLRGHSSRSGGTATLPAPVSPFITPTPTPEEHELEPLCPQVLPLVRWSLDSQNPYGEGQFDSPNTTDALAKIGYSFVTKVKVLALYYDPIIESMNNQRLHQVMTNWQDPRGLMLQTKSQLRTANGGRAVYVVTEQFREWSTHFDPAMDWTDATWPCYNGCSEYPNRGPFGYQIMFNSQFDGLSILQRVNNGEFDEIWVWGDPTSGMLESTMEGPNAFYINGGPVGVTGLTKRVTVMGLSYEVGIANALHSFGHRIEDIMLHVYNGNSSPTCTVNVSNPTNPYHHFRRLYQCLVNQGQPNGIGAVGLIHMPVNGHPETEDIDRLQEWNDPESGRSDANQWVNFPNFTSGYDDITCNAWGCTMDGYLPWWLSRVPRNRGRQPNNGPYNNLWPYIHHINCFPAIQ